MAELFKIAEQEALVVKPRKIFIMNRVAGWMDNK